MRKYVSYIFRRKLYFKIRNSWPVWFYLLNREGRRRYRQSGIKLDEVGRRIVGDLRERGIAFSSLEELFPGGNLLARLNDYARPLAQSAAVKNQKVFLKSLFDLVPELDFKNPFVNIAFDEKIFRIVSSYMGMLPKFRGYSLNIASPLGDGQGPRDSQRWHRDPEDKVVVKMFIYLNDVDLGTGPFIYLKGSHHLGKYRNVFPTDPPAGSYPPDGGVEKKVDTGDILVNTAPAGTVIFCETAGLHKGGYAKDKERLMFTSFYVSSAATSPIAYRLPEEFDWGAVDSGIARYALDK